MIIKTHYYPDKWLHIERLYKKQSLLEIHLINFLKSLLIKLNGMKDLDGLEMSAHQELIKFANENPKKRLGTITIHREKDGTCGGRTSYALHITRPGKFSSFEICEPIP